MHPTVGKRSAVAIATRLAAEGPGAVVIAVGGDGTVHEVGNGLLRGGQGRPEPAMAVLAAGSGNDFARQMAFPKDPAALLGMLERGGTRRIDAGRLSWPGGEEWFVNGASFGFTAAANRLTDAPGARHGRIAYTLGGVRAILSHRDYQVSIGLDGAEPSLVTIGTGVMANGAWFGAGMHVAPGARVDDGLFSMLTVAGAGRLRLLGLLAGVFGGWHLRSRTVSLRLVGSVRLEWEGDLPMEADGEPVAVGSPVEARVHPGALRVVTGTAGER